MFSGFLEHYMGLKSFAGKFQEDAGHFRRVSVSDIP